MSVMKKLLTVATIAAMFSCSMPSNNGKAAQAAASESRAVSATNRAPSANPPGGLDPVDVPMFVTFGYDDNGREDGMRWALDLMKGRVNPAGVGKAATYDGAPATVSFYNCTYYAINGGAPIKRVWREAYEAGHEIGNHTKTHGHGANYSEAQWHTEIDACSDYMAMPFDPNETYNDNTKGIGVPKTEIYGFRTPYLEYGDNLFKALVSKNMYDCSIEEGFQYMMDGTEQLWPYTLDNGSPGHDVQVEWGSKQPITPQPGLWEMPVYTVTVPPQYRDSMKLRQDWFDVIEGKITGFDYNLWVSFNMTKQEYLDTLKYTLDLKLAGNRSPMMLGAHTDYYSDAYNAPRGANATERKAAMKEFLDYAMSKSVVRVVSIKQILDWVKNPVPLETTINHNVTVNAGVNGTVTPSGAFTVKDGGNVKLAFTPAKGHMVDTVLVNGQPLAVSQNKAVYGYVDGTTTIDVTFKPIPKGDDFQVTYYWTYDYKEEPVDMNTPMVDMKDVKDQVIATVPQALAERIAMEGSGFIPDGRLLNLNNEFGWPQSRFMVVDQAVAPYGYDAQGNALVPWKSVAADPEVIPSGADIYIKAYEGLTVPGGMVHDGWFKAVDTSHSFGGFQIDIFAGTYNDYHAIEALTNNVSVMEVYCENFGNVVSHSIMSSSDNNGTIWPEGNCRVKTGKGEYFYFFPNNGYEVNQVLVDGVAVTYNTVDNNILVDGVTTDKTIHVTFKSDGTIKDNYTITTEAVLGTIDATRTVARGTAATFNFAPANPAFELVGVYVDGALVATTGTSYTFDAVNTDSVLKVVYKDPTVVYHTVATSKVGNGTIDATATVEAGQNVTINYAAAAGWEVAEVLVDGAAVAATGSVSFTAINADHTVAVTFTEIPFTSTLTATYSIDQDWGTGFGGSVVVKNNGTTAVNSWKVVMTYSGNQTISGWNALYSQTGNVVTVTNTSWNGTVQPGGTVSFGFNGAYTGTNEVPSIVVTE